jgi:hypothetical protein
VLVIGDSMAREYNENDIAYVDPHLHPKKGDPCVFQGIREDGTVEAMLKYLDRSPDASETLYYVYQTNPPKPVYDQKGRLAEVPRRGRQRIRPLGPPFLPMPKK